MLGIRSAAHSAIVEGGQAADGGAVLCKEKNGCGDC
jgi:hypothetical protein